MKKLEFSKWLLIGSYGVMALITISTFIIFFIGYSIDSLIPIVLASWAEVATVNMFYMKKARVENKIKIAKSIDAETLEKLSSINNLFD